MLIRFVTSNFLSFNEEREFNMLAGSYRTHKHHIYRAGKLNVLKGAAIYGANGAGKSNLVKAIDFLKNVVEAGKLEKSVNSKKYKLDKNNIKKPVEFEIEFYFKRKIYSYGVRINGHTVEQEWLYISGINVEDKLIFERENKGKEKPKIKVAKKYLKTQKDRLLIELMEDNLLKHDELLLGKSDSLKITDISNIREWITEKLIVVYPQSKFEELLPLISLSDKFTTFANELLRTFDTGVKALMVENIDFDLFFGEENQDYKSELMDILEEGNLLTISDNTESFLITNENDKLIVKKVVAVHHDSDNNKVNFELFDESDGTRRLLDFIPVFAKILDSDTTFIIDEIDQSLHPALLDALVRKIMRDEKTQGQLIFTTHESSLLNLNIFRQDEIWFTEKDKTGATQLYSLSDFNPRYDLDIRKGYLKGRFGAIPFTADLKTLNWEYYYA